MQPWAAHNQNKTTKIIKKKPETNVLVMTSYDILACLPYKESTLDARTIPRPLSQFHSLSTSPLGAGPLSISYGFFFLFAFRSSLSLLCGYVSSAALSIFFSPLTEIPCKFAFSYILFLDFLPIWNTLFSINFSYHLIQFITC